MTKRILFLCCFLMSLNAFGQKTADTIPLITKERFEYDFKEGWKVRRADSIQFSQLNYNDSSWITVDPHNIPADLLDRVIWFRYRFRADSSITGRPLGMGMTQSDASELYLDGKMIKIYGQIGSLKSSEYIKPKDVPFAIVIPDTGEHILAVRYSYLVATKHSRENSTSGFSIQMGNIDGMIGNRDISSKGQSVLIGILIGLFFAIGVSNLILFVFSRTTYASLFFSLFCFCMAAIFAIGLMDMSIQDGEFLSEINHYLSYLLFFAAISLCLFVDAIFKTRWKILSWSTLLVCIGAEVFDYFNISVGSETSSWIVAAGLFFWVMLQIFIVTIRAIIRKVEGAKIVGFGFLLFAGSALLSTLFFVIRGSGNVVTNDTGFATVSLIVILCLFLLSLLCIPFSMSAHLAYVFANTSKKLKVQLTQVELLSAQNLQQEQEKKQILENQNAKLEAEVAVRTAEVVQRNEELREEKNLSDNLLLNILPAEVAEELKANGLSEAKQYNNVTVLFTDFVNFTSMSERLTPHELVAELHDCFKMFDEITGKYNIEKIKTIGDAYLAVCGLPQAAEDHAEKTVLAAQEIIAAMAQRKQLMGDKTFDIRIGINSGTVVAGIVGIKKFAYDIWGDAVNIAARMEQSSEAGKINISQSTYNLIRYKFACTYRGKIDAKNKGAIDMYFV